MEATVKTMYGDILIHESIALLQEGRRVILAVKGSSMHPFIIGGKESVELVKPQSPLKVGDVVLAWVNGTHFAVHRIVGIEGKEVSLMGDGNTSGIEHCLTDDVAAVAELSLRQTAGADTSIRRKGFALPICGRSCYP